MSYNLTGSAFAEASDLRIIRYFRIGFEYQGLSAQPIDFSENSLSTSNLERKMLAVSTRPLFGSLNR